MSDEEYQEELDEAEELQEGMKDLQEAQIESIDSTIPQQRQESNLFNLFWKVAKAEDSTKFANLNKVELGMLNVSVRDSQRLALLGATFHHQGYGQFWARGGEIINKTSMSKDGWFTELFVSQKKFTTRSKKHSSEQPGKEKWRIFKKPNTPET